MAKTMHKHQLQADLRSLYLGKMDANAALKDQDPDNMYMYT